MAIPYAIRTAKQNETAPRRIAWQMEDKVSNAQLDDLINFLVMHPNLAKGLRLGPRSKDNVDLLWTELAQRLNSRRSGATKTGVQWKKYWIGYKHRLKIKASNCIKHIKCTGGGPPLYDSLSEVEKKALGILGEAAISGDTEYKHSTGQSSVSPIIVYTTTTCNSTPLDAETIENTSDDSLRRPNAASEDIRPPVKVGSWVIKLEQRRIAAEEKLADAAKVFADAAMISAEAARTMAQGQIKILEILNKAYRRHNANQQNVKKKNLPSDFCSRRARLIEKYTGEGVGSEGHYPSSPVHRPGNAGVVLFAVTEYESVLPPGCCDR
ncbi:hypothetical protein EVAR_64912_1 [Eumeta japonica]|uniref:Uncharacterized protein n=1 Tax=Eumeta variegata TaxID=151549 RepID=A0A4C1ZNL0_EUMVA|nr:hypothetical protein EVAR_64912_1 [Eumeta japonica]